MKIVKHKNLMGFLFAIFLMLPLFSILVRGLYVTFNKNAKDSYSGLNTTTTYTELQPNQITYNDEITSQLTFSNVGTIGGNAYLYLNNLEVLSTNATFNFDLNLVVRIDLYVNNQNLSGVYFKDSNASNVYTWYPNSTSTFVFKYNFLDFNNPINTTAINFNKEIVNTGTQLDNAFSYSISEFVNDNSSKLNFFSFFADLFLDLNSPQVNLYVSFVNWYLNYTLLISLGYLLFMFLMWFINYIRQLLEKGNSFGHGGF